MTVELPTLPDGATCADCEGFALCAWHLRRQGGERTCDWEPSRFTPKPEPSSSLPGNGAAESEA